MNYSTHELIQNTPEWLAYRANCYNASDAGTALGLNPNKTRQELIRELATGITKEVDAGTQRRFDDGHRFEKLALPLAEAIIGEPLSATTVSLEVDGLKRRLSASLDGATFGDTENVEHKTLSQSLAAAMDRGELPEQYPPQMEQGMMITGATRCLFIASKWDANDQLIDEKHVWYESNPSLRDKIIAAWRQVEVDVANYQHVEVIPAAVAAPVKDLPAVIYKMDGMALTSNLPAFREAALVLIEDSKKPMETDQDFADRIELCKKFGEAEKRIDLLQAQVIGEIHDVNAFCTDLNDIAALFRHARLSGEKLVEAEKINRRTEILQEGRDRFSEYVAAKNAKFGKPYMPVIVADFAAAIKGKSKLDNMRDAVDTLLANKKIEVDAIAEKIETNLGSLRELAADYTSLFPDTAQLVQKANEDLVTLIESRIAHHKAAEATKLEAERQRIRAEEEAKAKAAVEAQAKAAADAAAKIEADRTVTPPAALKAAPSKEGAGPAVAAAHVERIADTGRQMNLSEICARLDFNVTALLLDRLGFSAKIDRNSKLYRESDFPMICQALINHIAAVANEKKAA